MLSAQIDELRATADEIDWEFPFVASRLRGAADTIWELREELQQANKQLQETEHEESRAWDRVHKAESQVANLREELEAVGVAAYQYGREGSDKLRELASTMWPYIWEAYYSGEMQYKDYATIRDRMQELGIGGSR